MKPIRPIVTDRPTETMNSTIPEARPPSRMLAIRTMSSMEKKPPPVRQRAAACSRWEAPDALLALPFLELLAHVLHRVDGADVLLHQPPAGFHHLAQVLVHHDVAGV